MPKSRYPRSATISSMKLARIHTVLVSNIRAFAAKRKMPVSHVADRAGISVGNLSDILNEKVNPTIYIVEQIADALEVDVADLLRDSTKSNC